MAANRDPRRADRTSLRDAGIRRVRTASRWLAGGAVVLTGAFAGLAATTTRAKPSATVPATNATQQPASSQHDSSGSAQLQAPSQAPQQTQSGAQPNASSGAS